MDAISEGEFDRLHAMHKLLLVLYRGHRHTKYAFELFRLEAQISALCTPKMATQLKFGRFYNRSGGKGNNYPLDLHMEHQIRNLKGKL